MNEFNQNSSAQANPNPGSKAVKVGLVLSTGLVFFGLLVASGFNYVAWQAEKTFADLQVSAAVDSNTAEKDACHLLTKEEITRITRVAVSKVDGEAEGGAQSKCIYSPGRGAIYPIWLEVNWEGGKTAMALIQDTAPALVPGSENSSELGDASYFGPMESGVWVLKKDVLFSLNFGLAPISRDKKIELAERVLAKLTL